jgi:5,5'-dehydrodivanillate O-demethylase
LCSHRRANLCLGNTEKQGLRCRYHGWLYDVGGKVLQTPGEPAGSKLKDSVHHLSYPTEELGGLVFAYLGPKPVSLLPRFHFLAAEGERDIYIQAFNDCNWLQCVENGIDPFHVSFVHSDVWTAMEKQPEKIIFEETEWGGVYKAIRPGRKEGEYNYREHPVIMPGISSGGDSSVSMGQDLEAAKLPTVSARWSVPVDDEHTMNVRIHYRAPGPTKGKPRRKDPANQLRIEPYKEYKVSDEPVLGYTIPSEIAEEDATILDSLGPIVDRENENLSVIDGGIVLIRQMYLNQVETVKAGKDPKGVIRKATDDLIVIGGRYGWMSNDDYNQLAGASA